MPFPLVFYPLSCLTEILTESFNFFTLVLISPHVQPHGLLEDESPHGNLRIIYLYYLTTTLTVVSHSTITASILASMTILALSVIKTVSTILFPV